MKGYIVLKNGTVVTGHFEGTTANIMGHLSAATDGTLSIVCEASGSCVEVHSALSEATFSTGKAVFMTESFDLLSAKLSANTTTVAKLVIDDLPFDYHLYDVKTWLGYTHPIAS